MFQITRRKLNMAFWGFYILSAAVLISGLMTSGILAAILLSIIVIAMGFQALLEEITARDNRRAFGRIDRSLQQITEWVEKSHLFAKAVNEKHNLRLHHLDVKRALAEQKVERLSRDMEKFKIELENSFSSFRKSLAPEEKPLSPLEARIARAVTMLRSEGLMTTSLYSKKLGVNKFVARNDLKKMAEMRIVRKRGKGKNVYFILGI
jgi:Fic family protein